MLYASSPTSVQLRWKRETFVFCARNALTLATGSSDPYLGKGVFSDSVSAREIAKVGQCHTIRHVSKHKQQQVSSHDCFRGA